MIKNILKFALLGAITLGFVACTEEETQKKTLIKVGATPVPHSEILEFAKPLLKEKVMI